MRETVEEKGREKEGIEGQTETEKDRQIAEVTEKKSQSSSQRESGIKRVETLARSAGKY